ncbi:uncharacterized protein LACBIDRAFT_304319 [Laccaria bicolor S238N-H82]|uniref:Predicted protein n=1 Tax=Laccaria bicolor (strain S238N-H82 / ATCC MYA-4686) TaxID=486041 RepID=B0DLD5_LACBS|nr:uncharacterized protein LACBIDRAFT_304319 [Laccaria bicolor S238N-H82]EDR04546.1 predicted protein [Laccaria bicolor S238N-H82]|eukprot:XP_001884718.1 predicted protein [Laccaria bicolor S238N-H82]
MASGPYPGMRQMIEIVNKTSAVDLIFERVYEKAKEWEDAEKRGDDPDKIKAMDFSAGAAVSLFAAIVPMGA